MKIVREPRNNTSSSEIKTKVTANWDEDNSEWIKLNRKYVRDTDGFYTDYTLYTNGSEYICMFGDEEIYRPDPDYADFYTDSEEEAMEWFDSYDTDDYVEAATDDELEHPDQEYDSAATSINSNKLPAIYRMVDFKPGQLIVDLGGGKFDNGVYFVKDKGATLLVYDPYNRSDEHNQQVLAELKENGGADIGLNSNVLNVIKEPEARLAVLRNLKRMVKPGGEVYITVYEGTGRGNEGPTKAGYQLNRKTADYLEEVQAVFPDAVRKGKLIKAVNASNSIYGKQVYCTSIFASDADIDAENLKGMSREEIERILDEAPVGTKVIHIRNLKNRFNMDEVIRKKQAYKSNYFSPVGAPGDFNSLDTYWTKGGYEDPYIDKTIYDAVNGTSKYYGLTSEVLKAHGITSASYGGAYDVLDEYYFTRDDLVDFGEEVVNQLENLEPGDYFVNDLYMIDPKTIHIEVYCRNKESYADKNVAIDMRRIHKPSDLNKYAYGVATDLYDEFSEYDEVYGTSDYQIMKKSYRYSKKFKSQGDEDYINFIHELDNKGVPHDQYDNIKDDGCTVFYDEPETPIVSATPSFKRDSRIAKDVIEQFVGGHNGTDAVISANDIGYSSFQDPRLQPPEYDEPEEENTEELVEFSFDEVVNIDSNGSWEYEDKSYGFANNPDSYDGDWYTEDYDVYFRDVIRVVEDMDSVLEKNMPMQAGRYRITGDANLYYNVYGIEIYTDHYGPDDYDQTIVDDGVQVEFNYGKSHIDNLIVQKLS